MENENVSEELDPTIAAGNPFAGGNSRAARSLRARRQLRDRKGRFIKMGGGLKFKIRNIGGRRNIGRDSQGRFVPLEEGVYNLAGRSIGASDLMPEGIQVYVENDPNGFPDGFVTVPSTSTDVASALLSPEQLERAGIDAKPTDETLDSGVVDAADILYSDAPEGWEKLEDGTLKTIEDDINIKPTQDGKYELSEDGQTIDTFDKLDDAVIEANDRDAETSLSEEEKQAVATLRNAGDEEGAKDVIRSGPIATLPEDKAEDVIKDLRDTVDPMSVNPVPGIAPGSETFPTYRRIDGWMETVGEKIEAPAPAEDKNERFGPRLTVEDLDALPENAILRTDSLPGDTIANPNSSFIKKDGQWVNMGSSDKNTVSPEDLVNSDRGVRRNQPLEDFWNDPNRGPVHEAGTLVRAGNTSGDTRKFRVLGPDANRPGKARYIRTDERPRDRFNILTDDYSSVVPDTFDPNGDFVVLDTSGNIDRQINDAIVKNKMVAFMYGGKPRLLVPLSTETRFRSDDKNLKAVGEDGVEKNFSYSKMEPLEEGIPTVGDKLESTPDDGLGTEWANEEWRDNAPDGAVVEVSLPERFGGFEVPAYKYNGRWYVASEAGGGGVGEIPEHEALFDDITDENWFLESEGNILDQGGTPESIQKAYDETRFSMPRNTPAPAQQTAELPTSEALINDDIAAMDKDALDAEDSRVRARIAEIRALPEEDQNPDELDDLSERLTDISLRRQDLEALDRGESISGPAIFPAPGDTATEESLADAPNGTVVKGLSTVVVSNDGTSRETVPARAYKKNGKWFMYADKQDSPVFDQIGFPEKVNTEVDPDSVLDGTFDEPNSIADIAVVPNENGVFVVTSLGERLDRNVGGDTNDLPTLERRLAMAKRRLDRAGDDIHGNVTDEQMLQLERDIDQLESRIEAIKAGDNPPIDEPVTDLPELKSATESSSNSDTYATSVSELETADSGSQQVEIAKDVAVTAHKSGDKDVQKAAADVVRKTEVYEEAETAQNTPGLKKKLSKLAETLLTRLEETTKSLKKGQRTAKVRRDVRSSEEAERRIAAIQRTLDFVNAKASQGDDYDPRATRDYVLENTVIHEESIERDENGNLISAEGTYVAPTGVVYVMSWDRDEGTTALLAADFVDPATGKVYAAGSDAGFLKIHRTDDPDYGPIIDERDGIAEIDGGVSFIIPAYIKAEGGKDTPFKTIGAGMHGWTAAMASLEGSRYQHSSYLLPPGRVSSHRFHTSQPVFHSRSQREKMFDLLKAPTSQIMRSLGYHKRFDEDPNGELNPHFADATLWWGEFDRNVDVNIAKFAVIMFERFANEPDAQAGVDYPQFLESYIKGGDISKIEQLSLADKFYTLNYEDGDRSEVANEFRSVILELEDWIERKNSGSDSVSGLVYNVANYWNDAADVYANLDPAFEVLKRVTEYLEDLDKDIPAPLSAPESAETTLRTVGTKVPNAQVAPLPTLQVPLDGTLARALRPGKIFNVPVDPEAVRRINAGYSEQEIKNALERAVLEAEESVKLDSLNEFTAAELAAALNERGVDDYRFVGFIYDQVDDSTTNLDALNKYYEENKDMLGDYSPEPVKTGYILAPLQRNTPPEGLKYAMDPAPYEPVGTEIEGTSDDPQVIADTFKLVDLQVTLFAAMKDGDSQARLRFPSESGADSIANVPVEAIRDAVQLRGGDTNHLANLALMASQGTEEEEREVDTSNVPATPASTGATPTPHTSVPINSNDSMSDTTADPTTGAVTAADVDLDDANSPDAFDPEVIMQVIRDRYPNAVEMANGDLIVDSHETTDADGNRIEFQTVVVRTRQEFFYTYIRRINHVETDPNKKYQSLRFGRMSQSARALDNTIKDARDKVTSVSPRHGSNTMNRWWNEPGQRGRVQQETVNPETNEPEHVREQPIDRETVQAIVAATKDEQVSEAVVRGIFRHITQHGASQTVLNRLRAQFGMSRESMNSIVDAINEHVAKQDRIRRFDTWVSADGETPLFEGDIVIHPSTGRRGRVVRRIIEHRTHDYGYSDYLFVQFDGEREQRNITSRKLELVETSGGTNGSERRGPGAVSLPDPTLTTRAQNRMIREGRLNDFSPEQLETDRFSGPLPTVTIEGKSFPIRGSRQTVLGDDMDIVSGDLSTAEVGDFTTTLDPETGELRAREIIGIEQNPDGTTTVYTFLPIDFGSGYAEGTTYAPNEDGTFGVNVPLYRQRPTENDGLATDRDRETLGTAVSEADPASVPAELDARVKTILAPDSPATSREANDTAIEVSQLPKQAPGSADSIPLADVWPTLSDVKAEAPGDSTINLSTIETAATLQGSTPEEKMADAPAWFKNPMTPEAVDEKMGGSQTPATPTRPEMPSSTTPFEELPDEETPATTTPRFVESDGESPSPRTPDVIQQEIADIEEKLVRARSSREALSDDPILTEAIDSRIAELESQLNDLNVELSQETNQGPEFPPDETPFGEEPSDGGDGGGPKAPTPDNSGNGGGVSQQVATTQSISLTDEEVASANEVVQNYLERHNARINERPTSDEVRELPIGSFLMYITNKRYGRYVKVGEDTWQREDALPSLSGSRTTRETLSSRELISKIGRSIVAASYSVRPIDNTNGAPATSTTIANAEPGFVFHNKANGDVFTKQEDGTWTSTRNDVPISNFQMVAAVGQSVHSFDSEFYVGPAEGTNANQASTANVADYVGGPLESPDIPGWREASEEEIFDRTYQDTIDRFVESVGRYPTTSEYQAIAENVKQNLKNYRFYINGTVEIGIANDFASDSEYVKTFVESVEELRVNNPLGRVKVLLSSKGDRQAISGFASFRQTGGGGSTIITVKGRALLDGNNTLSVDNNESGFFTPSYGTVDDIKYTLVHEWGHAIDYMSGATMREQLWTLINQNPELKRQLTTYAASQPAEAFAELFAQLYLQKHHGASPIELANLIERVLG